MRFGALCFLGFFYGTSAVKFDITYALPIPPNIRRNFVLFFIVYGAFLFEGTLGMSPVRVRCVPQYPQNA